jgi:hypothetical protein
MRRPAEQRETERRQLEPAALIDFDHASRADVIARLQQGAGNQAVAAMLARVPAELDTEPHEGGDAAGLLAVLAPPEAVADVAVASAPEAGPDPLADWLASAPATNATYAQWIVDGATHGFVLWTATSSQSQMTKLAAGEKVSGTDPAKAEILGALKTLKALVAAKAGKWQADQTLPKETVGVGSFIRGSSPHDGRAIDINKLDWTGTSGPVQVEEALRALPAGAYGIGLPFQGEFFPRDEFLDVRKAAAVTAAGEGGTPAAITTASLKKFTGSRYTAAYTDSAWVETKTSGQAVSQIKSGTLKAAITELNGAGYSIYVFPDNDNHIHIQNP